jgi:hypothetical protein
MHYFDEAIAARKRRLQVPSARQGPASGDKTSHR